MDRITSNVGVFYNYRQMDRITSNVGVKSFLRQMDRIASINGVFDSVSMATCTG